MLLQARKHECACLCPNKCGLQEQQIAKEIVYYVSVYGTT